MRYGVPRLVALGVLWAVVLAASELSVMPVGGHRLAELALLSALLAAYWAPIGVAIAAAAQAVERRVASQARAVAMLAIGSVGAAAVWSVGANPLLPRLDFAPQHLNAGADLPTRFVYLLWIVMFYGLPYGVALVLVARAQRHRATLAAAELARSRTLGLVHSAALARLRERVDSALLLRSLTEAQARFEHDGPGAQRLLDALAAHLRAAMPAVRGLPPGAGAAGDAVDAAIRESHARLLAELGAAHPSRGDPSPPCDLPHPEPADDPHGRSGGSGSTTPTTGGAIP